ncbi:MAG: hypothetical protein HKN16_07320 [Saprospiraceae bacterium]|nr:hypothetical protein [Saprospiraceae bacterium]
MRWLPLLISFFLFQTGWSQAELPESFVAKSIEFDIRWPNFSQPDFKFKVYQPEPALDQIFDLGVFVPKEKYRLLVFFKPEGNPPIPHVEATLKANHFAKNAEHSMVAIHTFDQEGLDKHNVDWGATYYFKPKEDFSFFAECQMICLFKLGKGSIFLLYLFDDFSPQVEEKIWNPVFEDEEEVEKKKSR